MEYRSENGSNATVVEDTENEKLKVTGTVNKAGEPSKTLKDKNGTEFVEVILPDTFQKAIEKAQAENKDIKLLVNHDETKILARTGNGSLVLEEKDGKTVFKAELPETTLGKDIYELINKGLSFGMSFGFEVAKDEWTKEGDTYKREVSDMVVNEISILTIEPAYNSTEVQAEQRALEVPKNITINEKEVQKPMKTLNVNTPEESLNTILKEERALQTTSEGAAVIPENVANELIKRIESISPVFEMARKFPSTAGSLKVARENEATTQAGFVGEGADLNELAVNFSMVTLTNKRVGGYITLSNQLIIDSATNMDEYIPDLLARQTAKAIEKSILVGEGGTEFNGILNDKDVQAQAVEVQAITYDALMDVYLSLKPEFLKGAAWIVNEETFKAVAKLKDGNGQPYLMNGTVNGEISYNLFGIPVYTTSALPDEQPIVLANIEQAVAVMIKQDIGLQEIQDANLSVKGGRMFVLEAYMDSTVVNPQAIAVMKVPTVAQG